MLPMKRLLSVLVLALGAAPHSVLHAQPRTVEIDVASVELMSGRSYDSSRLLLIDGEGAKHVLPSGTFKSENGAAIIILDGRVTSVGTKEGRRIEIGSARVARASVSLIGTNGDPALIPDGKYVNGEGSVIAVGRGVILRAIIVVTGD